MTYCIGILDKVASLCVQATIAVMANDNYVDTIYNDNIDDRFNNDNIDNDYNLFICMPLYIVFYIHIMSTLYKWHNTKQESTMFRTRLHNHFSVIFRNHQVKSR